MLSIRRSTVPTTITASSSSEVTVVTATGELDGAVTDRLRHHLAEAVADTPPALIIDFGEVSFCSAAVLGVLVEITAAAETADVRWAVVSDQRAVRRPTTLSGLDPVLLPMTSVPEACASLRTPVGVSA
ncbi:STAS domain-containing protein [Actinosynnema mirum]|uniref:Anti-sigma factor antagonist n=1 Tax=Actinosynnema mirum (strain ATCC 29888 / DSM 43827 / JCM 3225 / NBRC 14064 / NCIMB 13271 / NRRL B-12336 / IMRU 3971 / 101) TaxID=446462 RepID=C6WML3_ACTMD|nr:STAS domain-containing protein [Actinosynnema mirum]ACU36542.1 anti-sigma-factor antagonist [Actinosynnema mirum DSM 43827]